MGKLGSSYDVAMLVDTEPAYLYYLPPTASKELTGCRCHRPVDIPFPEEGIAFTMLSKLTFTCSQQMLTSSECVKDICDIWQRVTTVISFVINLPIVYHYSQFLFT